MTTRTDPTLEERVRGTDDGDAAASPGEAFSNTAQHVKELQEYAKYFIAAKMDGWKLSVSRLVMMIAVGAFAGIVGVAMVATAAVLLVVGIAQAIGMLFPDRYGWLGNIITGVVLVGGSLAAAMILPKRLLSGSFKQTVKDYEDRQRNQRQQFGTDVRSRASGQ